MGHVQEPEHDREGDEPDREVDEKHPAPSGDEQDGVRSGEQPADEGADEARYAEHGEEVALVFGAVTRRQHVAHSGEGERHESAGAETLHGAEDRELVHARGDTRQQRTDEEDADGDDEQGPAAEDVAELAVDRRRDGRHHQVGGRDPRLQAEPVEVVGNGFYRRSDDGLIERGQEHAGHEAVDHKENLPMSHGDARGRRRFVWRRIRGLFRRFSAGHG